MSRPPKSGTQLSAVNFPIWAVDRGDGQVAWEPFTNGSERPLVFSARKDALAAARDHNRRFKTPRAWKVVKCEIVLRSKEYTL